jgi:ribosome-interacting GTPase 1
MPKHKGTEHLQGDLRRRLSKLREGAGRAKAKKTFDPFRVEKGGAGQVLLLGPPNSGKSALVARLTKAPTAPADFPFATQGPIPGMMSFEDAQVQIVDLPPITRDYFPAGLLGLIKTCDAALVTADLGAETLLEDLEAVLEVLEEGRVHLFDPDVSRPPEAPAPAAEGEQDESEKPARPPLELPARLLACKADLAGARDQLEILSDLYKERFRPWPVSTLSENGLEAVPSLAFRLLDRIRVYSKLPGRPPDLTSPFILRRGQTVLDLAALIHRDFPEELRQAKVWGSARFDGQAVDRDYVLADKDVVELQLNR